MAYRDDVPEDLAGGVAADVDVFRAADLVLKQHREGAVIYAAQRADAMLESEDIEGSIVWLLILKAIEKIRSPLRRGWLVN